MADDTRSQADVERPQYASAYLVAVITIFFWGAMPAATRFAVDEIDPITVGALRSIIAGGLLLPALFITRAPLPNTRSGWFALGVSALGGFVIYQAIFAVGISLTSTAHAALILASAPIFTGLIGFFVERDWPRWIWWLGAAIAMAGEFILITARADDAGGASLTGDLMILCGIFLVGAANVAGGQLTLKIGTWPATGWSLAVAGLVLAPVPVIRSAATDWTQVTTLGWTGVIYLATISSMLGYAGWYWALARAGAARIAPVQFAQPLVSLVLAVFILSEEITLPIAFATVMILAGIAVTRRA